MTRQINPSFVKLLPAGLLPKSLFADASSARARNNLEVVPEEIHLQNVFSFFLMAGYPSVTETVQMS